MGGRGRSDKAFSRRSPLNREDKQNYPKSWVKAISGEEHRLGNYLKQKGAFLLQGTANLFDISRVMLNSKGWKVVH